MCFYGNKKGIHCEREKREKAKKDRRDHMMGKAKEIRRRADIPFNMLVV